MKYRAYLDIETTGLSRHYCDLTVIGIALEKNMKCKVVQLIENDLYEAKLLKVLNGVDEIYSYNGSRFDLPFIKAKLGASCANSFDAVVYVLNLGGRRVFLTGDIGFHGNSHILNRCWGDVPKARKVMEILRERILPLKPEIVFTGHDEHSNGIEYWQDILRSTEEAMRKAKARGNQ